MNNLYTISEELLSIFNEIENNDGEVTEEQLEALEITQEQLQEKLTSYKRAIRCWEADIDACKQEEKRIKSARSVKENRINRLKDRMLFAVKQFGYDGKPNKEGKTNKFYELSDGRIFTKTTESVEINENRNAILINLLIDGPKNENLIKLIPEKTVLNNAEIKNNILYLDFSKEFIEGQNLGKEQEELIVKSIVNTVTELTEVNKVVFLIDGKSEIGFPDGGLIFNQIFVREK